MENEFKASEDWLSSIPLMDDTQAGSLRRILNLAAQLPDDWSGMQGLTTLQEDFGALRFQLAFMSFALGLTHVHHLPAAPGVFKQPFNSLIEKILSPDVWTYWHYISTGNGPFNKSIGKQPGQWDPVIKDNIMYSAYVQSMALLYHYLFQDDKYAAEGALTFSIDPMFWDEGGKHFVYDEKSLNDHLYWSMVERGYLGIACEPNCVFQICNQIPILGFRFHDFVYGGSLADEVTSGYLQAWSEFGVINDSGHFNMMVQEHERQVITPDVLPWTDFWMGSMMHAWNPALVREHYPKFVDKWVTKLPDGSSFVTPAPAAALGLKERGNAHDFGWAAVCASELGDTSLLKGLHEFADEHLQPAWQDGGYYYRRCDQLLTEDGLLRAMDPHTSNALLPYSRLNVTGGLRKLYEEPLQEEHFSQPKLISLEPSLDVHRAKYDSKVQAMVLTLKPTHGMEKNSTVSLEITNVWKRGDWHIQRDHETLALCDSDNISSSTSSAQLKRLDDSVLIEFELTDITTLVLSWK